LSNNRVYRETLIALATALACGVASSQIVVSPAPAPGGVTLFGVIDTDYTHGSSGGAGSASVSRLSNSGFASSRLGVRGTEDLGGGISASFWLEAGINSDDGSGAATSADNQTTAAGGGGLTFNRQSWVSVNGPWGSVRLGRDYSPQFVNPAWFDPFGAVGVGSIQMITGLTALRTTARGPYAPGNAVAFPGGIIATRVRTSNGATYFTPLMGGFYGLIQYHQGENRSDATTGANPAGTTKNDGNGYSLRAGYASGPITAGIQTSKTNLALLGDFRTSSLGASYDFDVVKVMGAVLTDKWGGSSLAGSINPGASGRGFIIGFTAPVGAGVVRFSYGGYKLNIDAGPDPETRKFALGYAHNLSKRTTLYATYARIGNRNGANTTLNGAVAGPGVVDQASTGFDIGVRHAF
jgi:predicted porin